MLYVLYIILIINFLGDNLRYKIFALLFLCLLDLFAQNKLRVGVLAYGTVNWELEVLKQNNLDKKNGFELEVVELASKNAQLIALQSKNVDVIVNDWIWVNSQRASGKDFTFYPYSKASGTLMVNEKSNIKSLADLKGKELGIGGGNFDKTWLLLRAYSKSKYNFDLKDIVNPVYSSAPIVNKKMEDTSLEAAINFWHFNAKLESKNIKPLIEIKDVYKEFGINDEVSFVGWTFSRNFALQNKELINSFLEASYESKKILNENNQEWNKIRKIMDVTNDKDFEALKNGYKAGIIKNFNSSDLVDLRKVFKILLEEGGEELVGKSTILEDETFWNFDSKIKW